MTELLLDLLTGRGVALPLGAFALAGAAVFLVAGRLAGHADAIAAASGLGRVWAGTILLAASTSLPELVTDVNAAFLGRIDIGIGDLFGSTLANMLVLGLLDLAYARRRLLDRAAKDHAAVGALGVALTAIAAAAIASGGWFRLGPVGFDTVAIVGVYALVMRGLFEARREAGAADAPVPTGDAPRPLRRAVAGFAVAALGLLVAAPVLVLSADAIAVETGLSDAFVGTLLVGLTTSFPEIAATVAAVRLGAPDLAVGNLLGSNAFNMCVLLAMDLAYPGGPLLADASPDHVLSALLGAVAVSIGMLGILARRPVRVGEWRLDSALIVLTYAAAAWLLASRGVG